MQFAWLDGMLRLSERTFEQFFVNPRFLRCYCAVCVFRGVVEVVAPLGFIQRGLCCNSTVWAIVDQVAAAIKIKGKASAQCLWGYVGTWLGISLLKF